MPCWRRKGAFRAQDFNTPSEALVPFGKREPARIAPVD